MATPAKQELLIKNLRTSHVILYPTSAHITRNIGNIELKPGPNQIEIYGLTPTADEHSIKVDGSGAASITDMTVDLVPNPESFEDAYPDESDSEDGESENEDGNDSDQTPAGVKEIQAEVDALRLRLAREQETGSIAEKALELFSEYCGKVEAKEMGVEAAETIIDTYRARRLLKHDETTKSRKEQDKIRRELEKKLRELHIATKDAQAEEKREQKKAAKERAKKQREAEEKRKNAERVRAERVKFWPKKVYRVVVHLDSASNTPGTSRRSSISSIASMAQDSLSKQKAGEDDTGTRTVSLTISYVTSDASWSPRYDIAFSTPNKSGSISYRAEFKNETSETWRETKVSLSTSQASFHGLGDEVPSLYPWHIGLTRSGGELGPGGLMSYQENSHKTKKLQIHQPAAKNRSDLFGVSPNINSQFHRLPRKPASRLQRMQQTQQQMQQVPQWNQMQAASYQAVPRSAPSPAGFGQSIAGSQGGGLFGSNNTRASSARTKEGLFASMPAPGASVLSGNPHTEKDETAEEIDFDVDEATVTDAALPPTIEFEDSTWEDHGLTQTYDIPGVRTLEPSSIVRRYKIATLPFSNLELKSIAVPKLRPASFMHAAFRNPSSSMTLLKGTAGLTLDGTFLGNTTLPRISPDESTSLSLGVDPAVQISYAKPTVKRSTHGVFNKESSQVFTRTIIITNSKPTVSELLVHDQIPVSEDEKLRVEILQPKNLFKEGDSAIAGKNAKRGKGAGDKWGKATATLKPGGEIVWAVILEKGCACQLAVEYEVKTPANEVIVSK